MELNCKDQEQTAFNFVTHINAVLTSIACFVIRYASSIPTSELVRGASI